MSEEFTPEQLKALDKIEKLMRLAAKNTSAEEAASAMARAQELLAAYNLSEESVGKTGATADQAREQKVIKGGFYQFQRDLWRAIAELNFCMYWTIEHKFPRMRRRRQSDGSLREVWSNGKEHRHTVVGKRINVKATMFMAEYLQSTIERLVKDRYPLSSQRFMSEAIAFREGIADEVASRLRTKRRDKIKEEERRREEELKRNGVSTSQALTLGSLAQQEADANADFVMGEEGYSARKRAERAEQARRQKEAEEAYTRWAAANPEEAAKLEKEQAKARKGRSRSYGSYRQTGSDRRYNMSTYWQGRDEGKNIGLDPQTKEAAKPLAIK